eukprot:gb/GECH01014580.1/.p1 GENE.gb/GECH01014580.1/~~gb/GECH01014580.1/.p1  ORF type:complete len:352 (+),score=90.12 gb/GECH01014580.1/:1-1056(+)
MVSPPTPPPPPSPNTTARSARRRYRYEANNETKVKLSKCESININDVNVDSWKTIQNISVPNEGKGVFIVQLSCRKVILVKGSAFIVEELFANQILNKLNIETPQMRIVAITDHAQEWYQIKHNIADASEIYRPKALTELNRAFNIVMEYIHGYSLNDTNHTIFSSLNETESILFAIGQIISVDILLNNWDRIPSPCWENEGNFGNILIQFNENKPNVIAIDNSFNKINMKNSKGINSYLKRISKFMDDLYEYESEMLSINVICKHIQNACGQKEPFSSEAKLSLFNGIVFGFKSIKNQFSHEIFKSMKRNVAKLIETDWKSIWSDGVGQIDIDFLNLVFDHICSHPLVNI